MGQYGSTSLPVAAMKAVSCSVEISDCFGGGRRGGGREGREG